MYLRKFNMDRRGEGESFLMRNLIYIVLVVAFFVLMFGFLFAHQGNAKKWEEFYAKELALAVDSSKEGTEFEVDVNPLTEIAFKRGLDKDEIVRFDNERNEVIVRATREGGTRFRFFNELEVKGVHLELAAGGENADRNILYFRLTRDEGGDGDK
jgi:hypothetical protein